MQTFAFWKCSSCPLLLFSLSFSLVLTYFHPFVKYINLSGELDSLTIEMYKTVLSLNPAVEILASLRLKFLNYKVRKIAASESLCDSPPRSYNCSWLKGIA